MSDAIRVFATTVFCAGLVFTCFEARAENSSRLAGQRSAGQQMATAFGSLLEFGIGHVGGQVEQVCQTQTERHLDLAAEIIAGASGAVLGKYVGDAAESALGNGRLGETIGELTGTAASSALSRYLELTLKRAVTSASSSSYLRSARQLCEVAKARRVIVAARTSEIVNEMARRCSLDVDGILSNASTCRQAVACMARSEDGNDAMLEAARTIYSLNGLICSTAQVILQSINRHDPDAPPDTSMPISAEVDAGCLSPDTFEADWSHFFATQLCSRR